LPGVEWIGMEKKELEAQSRSVDAVIQAVARIDAAEFAAYRGGWPGQVGMALVDAVFSIRARYDASALPRLRTLKEHHPEISDDLQALVDLGADEVRRVMGSTKTARRHKADCVIDAATAMLTLSPPLRRADEVREHEDAARHAYTSVRGLGPVTATYFLMLLGKDGVKPDRMIRRFVNAALAAENLGSATSDQAGTLLTRAHARDGHGVSLTAYEHAVWRAKGRVPSLS